MSDFEFLSRDISISPTIYAYSIPSLPGLLKVGYTNRTARIRAKESLGVINPLNSGMKLEYSSSAMRSDGSIFMDTEVHDVLEHMKCVCRGGEWYECTVEQVKKAIEAVRERSTNINERIYDFKMRPEQEEAVKRTEQYYLSAVDTEKAKTPKFLWNCKMRFGKTFASYQLAKKMRFTKVLVLTFKPAVKSAWKEDLNSHVDFDGWQFLSQPSNRDPYAFDLNIQYENADKTKPIVCFGSLQDMLGVDSHTGQIKTHNEWIHTTTWDLVIFDEYHYGAWREKAKDLFEKEDEEDEVLRSDDRKVDVDSSLDESFLPISTKHYLFLSGTPFRAINSGEFIEEQIFSWTYSDEQKAKNNWNNQNGKNPYEALPRMVMMTYKLPEAIRKIAMQGEYNEFDLNAFFSTKGEKQEAVFVYEQYVQKWLDLIRGSYIETSVEDLKSRTTSPFPFSDIKLRQALLHTLWFLPSINSCYAMKNLLRQNQNLFYKDYDVIVCAGSEVGQGADALISVESKMRNPLETKTITLSCGKLTTGVTVKPWTGVFMLRNLKQPETYFQTAFRVQSPWVAYGEIIKRECYVFDFAPNRTLRQLSEYCNRLNVKEPDPEKKVADFIKFLPVLAYEGNIMREINAMEVLDIAMSGTTATLLARRWESALLVNVDNDTLLRLLNHERAMKALMSIEAFRSLNHDIETIINKSTEVKEAKKKGLDKKGTSEDKKKISEEEKEFKSKRKEIQEKLIKFATRIPIFMYLTDHRERTLKDVITKVEPGLFRKVTGLMVNDFELLASLGVFNESLMNDAVFKFRRYEDSSLEYTGINKHTGEAVGGYSTVLQADEFYDVYGGKYPLKIGDKVEVKNFGICSVSTIKGEYFSIKSPKGKTYRYMYPDALNTGVIKILR